MQEQMGDQFFSLGICYGGEWIVNDSGQSEFANYKTEVILVNENMTLQEFEDEIYDAMQVSRNDYQLVFKWCFLNALKVWRDPVQICRDKDVKKFLVHTKLNKNETSELYVEVLPKGDKFENFPLQREKRTPLPGSHSGSNNVSCTELPTEPSPVLPRNQTLDGILPMHKKKRNDNRVNEYVFKTPWRRWPTPELARDDHPPDFDLNAHSEHNVDLAGDQHQDFDWDDNGGDATDDGCGNRSDDNEHEEMSGRPDDIAGCDGPTHDPTRSYHATHVRTFF